MSRNTCVIYTVISLEANQKSARPPPSPFCRFIFGIWSIQMTAGIAPISRFSGKCTDHISLYKSILIVVDLKDRVIFYFMDHIATVLWRCNS